jgi:hypothetical protein
VKHDRSVGTRPARDLTKGALGALIPIPSILKCFICVCVFSLGKSGNRFGWEALPQDQERVGRRRSDGSARAANAPACNGKRQQAPIVPKVSRLISSNQRFTRFSDQFICACRRSTTFSGRQTFDGRFDRVEGAEPIEGFPAHL